MRSALFSLLLLAGLATTAWSKPTPLTVREISLMLRNGFSAEMIEQDLAARHFIEPVDAAAEKSLVESGATPAFVEALKSGRYAVPATEIAAVEKEVAAQAARRAAAAEESKKYNTLYQDQLAQQRAAVPPNSVVPAGSVAEKIEGDLVTSRNGILHTFNDQALARKKLFALYFAARWCPSCRKFTPELVEYYNRIAPAHPEFEIIFISNDRSAPAMEAYMRDAQMPWPAVDFKKIAEASELTKYAGTGIPCLVLIDAQGRVISDSYDGKTYRGPQKVIEDLETIFAAGSPPVAQSR